MINHLTLTTLVLRSTRPTPLLP